MIGELVRPMPNADGAALLSTHVHPSQWWDDYVPHSVAYARRDKLYIVIDLSASTSGEFALLLGAAGEFGWMHSTFLEVVE